MSRRILLDVEGNPGFWIATAEDTILQKLLWRRTSNSEKQWRDVLGMLKLQNINLDYDYLMEWAKQLEIVNFLNQAIVEAGINIDH